MKKQNNISLNKMWDMLSTNVQNALKDVVEKDKAKTGVIRYVSIGSCPHCGSKNTVSCQKIPEIRDETVGLCLACGYIWCLECETQLVNTIRCGHREICSKCNEIRKSFGYCSTAPWQCRHIKLWLKLNYPTV